MLGWQELLIVLIIVMLIFGTSKVSGIGKSLGTAIRDFRDTMRGESPEKSEESTEQTSTEESPKESSKEANRSNE